MLHLLLPLMMLIASAALYYTVELDRPTDLVYLQVVIVDKYH